MSRFSRHLQIAQLLIGLVVAWNIQCALVFLISPDAYTGSFEMSGVAGKAVVQSFGILFIMWNIPYLFALWNPVKYRFSLIEALFMQAAGLLGETILFLTLPAGHSSLRLTASRFIVFDAAGLILLFLARWQSGKANI